ncbi:MAG: carbon storage regulator [Pirellulales bacterium]|nr:carbon storage regulator [Pirellulales bacterium]
MLVLSRRVGEEIVIDDTMRVVLLGVQGGRIRLGLSAPPHISIQRSEVRDRIASQKTIGDVPYVNADQENHPAVV